MDWDDLRYFLAVARKGSVRAAAAALSVNHTTVSRRISAFEKNLGVRLFERLPIGYILTTAGEEMMEPARRIEDEVGNLNRKLVGRDKQLQGVLRVTMPGPLASNLLMPDLAEFSRIYSGIELQLAISAEEFDLKKREADVAIRVTDTPPEYLIGRKVAHSAKAVYASHEYLAKHDINQQQQINWIGWDDDVRFPDWVKGTHFPSVPVHHQTNDLYTQLAAAKAGLGIVLLPCLLGDPDPALQRISMVSGNDCGSIWLLTHKDLRNTARVKTFFEFISKAFEKHRDLLAGERYHRTTVEHNTSIAAVS